MAKGLLFMVVGLLGLEIARRGFSGDDADQGGALAAIAEAPAGRLLVIAMGVGLCLYAVWQLWDGVVSSSDGLLGVAKRIGKLGLAVSYGLLGVTGVEVGLTGSTQQASGGGGATSPESISSTLLGAPGGRLLTAAIGLGTIAVGLYNLRKGISQDFLDEIDTDDLGPTARTALTALGTYGFAARGLMLGIAGALFAAAAWQFDPDQAAGLDDSLRTLATVAYGRWLLALASGGLIAAGLYDAVTFRRQRLGSE